ncbi:MAG: flavodoxin [Lachnospiraceae bacterium]|nr:flavodoxin [Lachnospiraceae bacterium]
MSAIKIVYWSQTGNTQNLAEAVAEGVQNAGGEAEAVEVGSLSADELKDDAVFALGCPAMGDEELDDGEMEPFVSELEGAVSGKKIALFGSYGWGDGQWMRDWTERMKNAGAEIVGGEGLACQEDSIDDEGLEACRKLGASLAAI